MNIYVGNLARETTEDNLRDSFSVFGEVRSVRIIRDGTTGESRGFGFLTMPIDSEARAAIDQMNGKALDGQTITVEQGRARAAFVPGRRRQRSPGARGGSGPVGNARGSKRREGGVSGRRTRRRF